MDRYSGQKVNSREAGDGPREAWLFEEGSGWGQVFRELLKFQLAVENCDRRRLRGVRGPISGPSATAGQLIRRSGGRIREKLRGIHPTSKQSTASQEEPGRGGLTAVETQLSQFNFQPFHYFLEAIWEYGAIRKEMK